MSNVRQHVQSLRVSYRGYGRVGIYLRASSLAMAVVAKLDWLTPSQVERLLPFALLVQVIVLVVVVVLVTEFARLRGIT